ncbi:hypothetical protein BASA81_018246 [Batrachochytrium salamandrivorans]|nr:hypothetical protein BASA81_018246 [Batrachochytrium salamandrivorans]
MSNSTPRDHSRQVALGDSDTYLVTLNNGSIYKNDLIMAESYSIKEFEPETIASMPGNMSITATTGAGKTKFIIDLLSKVHKQFDAIYLFSRTAKAQKDYNFIPRANIHDSYSEEFLVNLWQSHYNKKLVDQSAKLDKVLIVLKPLQRNNVRWAVAFDLDSKKEREKFVHSYLSAKNARVGELLFSRIVKERPYQACVVEVYKNGAETEDKVKKYVANPDVRAFKVKAVGAHFESEVPATDAPSLRTKPQAPRRFY